MRSSSAAGDGFSLIECVIALGIVAFAFVALLGLLPIGLTSFKVAKQETVRSEIVKFIDTQVQQTLFSDLTNSQASGGLQAGVFAFDEEGLPVAMNSADRLFVAETAVTTNGVTVPSPGANKLPGLAVVRVLILNQPPGLARSAAPTNSLLAIYASDRGQ